MGIIVFVFWYSEVIVVFVLNLFHSPCAIIGG